MFTVSGKSVLIALGANLPFNGASPDVTLRRAVDDLAGAGFADLRVSPFYASPAFPPGAGPDYVNAAAHARWTGAPDADAALAALHAIEERYGRRRDTRWGMRTLDLDLLAFEDQVIPDAATQTAWRDLDARHQQQVAPDRLILPHPRMQDRAFVLVPLADVAPDWCHPLIGRTVTQMLGALPAADRDGLTRLSEPGMTNRRL